MTSAANGKPASRTCPEHIFHEGLETRVFSQSKIDVCVHHRGDVALKTHTDDSTFIGPDQAKTQECNDTLTKDFVDKKG